MSKLNYNQLAAEIHANSVKHGWWENQPSIEHFLTLVVCELAEAVEADRKGNRCDRKLFTCSLATFVECDGGKAYNSVKYDRRWNTAFEQCVKDTVEDELADAVMRLLDIAGAKGYDFGKPFGCNYSVLVSTAQTFTENIGSIMGCVMCRSLTAYNRVACTLVQIEWLAEQMGIDLEWHIKHKMQYNASRPYKHGKAY
nr:MAG TPA: NTP-PPase-like protein [Caudoviricetes sp.]